MDIELLLFAGIVMDNRNKKGLTGNRHNALANTLVFILM